MKFLPSAIGPAVISLFMIEPAVLRAADAKHGSVLFQQSCALCHATGLDAKPAAGQGPLLAGVVGRRAASLADFGYTKALEESHLTWDAATLDRFLTSPTTMVPGTNMLIPIPDPTDRADVIAFLTTLRPVAPPSAEELAAARRHAPSPGDWQNDHPGARHRIRLDQLPAPYATSSAGNHPHVADRPAGAELAVPAGFQVKLFVSDLSNPRLMRTAPNGDIFIAETGRGRIRVLRTVDGADAPTENAIFVDQ
ncbi:MAG TPA: c-type cytochrome, partial [Xanthobacteraceae bacterium]|nr:c-type cytochrome [Xanthobacteraceae bacterium]